MRVILMLLVLLQTLASCSSHKAIIPKNQDLTEAVLINSLKPGKKYRFWDAKNLIYDKVKITSVDSVSIKGIIYYHGKKTFDMTPHEIVVTKGNITQTSFSASKTILLIGLGAGVVAFFAVVVPNTFGGSGL